MTEITIDIKDPGFFGRLLGRDSTSVILEAAGRALVNTTRRHFRARQSQPEKTAGFPKFGQTFGHRGFWAGTRGDSVSERMGEPSIDPAAGTVTVAINSPALAHKLNPSPPPIKPTGGRKYLAIPANPLAAKWPGMPRDFPASGGMKFGYAPAADGKWRPALVANDNWFHRTAKGRNAGKAALSGPRHKATAGVRQPVFWLVRQVRTPHDPAALPTAEALREAVNAAASAALDTIAAANSQNPKATP